jgi:hypothetical protein
MLFVQPLDKGLKTLPLDLADGQHQGSHPRRGDGSQGIQTHPDIGPDAGLHSRVLGMPAGGQSWEVSAGRCSLLHLVGLTLDKLRT